jgi:hypothetical protein
MGDLFSTSLGNVLAGERVRRLGMLWLRHDAEVGGLRFTIPTRVVLGYVSGFPAVTVTSISEKCFVCIDECQWLYIIAVCKDNGTRAEFR